MAGITQQHIKGRHAGAREHTRGSAGGKRHARHWHGHARLGGGLGRVGGLRGGLGRVGGLRGGLGRVCAGHYQFSHRRVDIGLQHCSASRARGSLQCTVPARHALQCKQGTEQPAVHCAS